MDPDLTRRSARPTPHTMHLISTGPKDADDDGHRNLVAFKTFAV